MRDAGSALIVVLAVAFLVFHVPYLPTSLEDLDSVNFALGVREFDVARHQPHPPGYPVFILMAKAVHAVVPSEARALALISVVAGALGVLAMAAVFRRLDGRAGTSGWTVATVAVAMTAPLYWFTAVRPLSDSAGLTAALAVQAMTLAARSGRSLAIAALCAGLATGLRSQVAWLTVPLLIVRGLGAGGWGLRGGWGLEAGDWNSKRQPATSDQQLATSNQPLAPSPQPLAPIRALLAFVGGLLLWFIPLVVISGGPAAYWRALSNQGAEDLGNIQMLWTAHGARDVADALYYAFIAPWATWPIAAAVLVCGAVGVVWSYRRARPALAMLAAAFGPYLILDLLFQETFTSRYALPLVVPMAYFAVAGLRLLPYDTGLAVAVAIAMFDAHVGGTSIAAFSREKPPAFRLLDDMRAAAPTLTTRPAGPPVLAMDRRQSFDFRRPVAWVGDAMPPIARTLPAPPQHEWLEAVKYWNSGGSAPVWFVVDPMRTSIDLVQHGDPVRYRWPLPYPVLVSGARPSQMDWYTVDRPEWYVGEGWALTPEAAGVSERDGTGLARAPITAWASRSTLGGILMIGGRNFEPAAPTTFSVAIGGVTRDLVEPLPPGPFLRFIAMPATGVPEIVNDYVPVVVTTTPPVRVGVEQFDASATRPIAGFGPGWHEQEFNPRTGLRWRWLSERGELHVRSPTPRLTLHVDGESPRNYFPRGSRLVVRSGARVLFEQTLSDDFSLTIPIEQAPETIALETDQVFAPADRSSRSGDRRHLGLRIFRCELRIRT